MYDDYYDAIYVINDTTGQNDLLHIINNTDTYTRIYDT
jgi:hypothetical protein